MSILEGWPLYRRPYELPTFRAHQLSSRLWTCDVSSWFTCLCWLYVDIKHSDEKLIPETKSRQTSILSCTGVGTSRTRLKKFRPRVLLFISRNFGCAHFCDIRVCSKMKLIQAVSVYFWVFVVCKQNGESILRYSFFVRAKLRSLMFVPCIGAIYNFFHVFSWNCSVERELYPSELTVDERLNVPSTVDASAVVTLKMNCFSTVSIFVATFGLVDGSYSFVRHFS